MNNNSNNNIIIMLVKLFFITLCIQYGYSAKTIRETGDELTISECAAKGGECDETKGRPVCGTDNQTYPTRCHLIRAQCSGHQVSIKHRGTCKDACVISRSYALSHSSSFVPRCRNDGTYAPVQCSKDNTICWCVTSQGKPIENTTSRTGKPFCAKLGKSNIRRSSPRNDQILIEQKRICTKSDRIIFNTNIIDIFYSEHKRYFTSQAKYQKPNDKILLDWKFTTLDLNKNDLLDKIEYRELKKIVKKAVKPKRCARAFGKYCDIDHDERLSRQEWAGCLSKEIANLLRGKTVELSGETSPVLREIDGESDCLADRAAALDEQTSGTQPLYVPDCTPDGRYQRVQCYRSTGYCWCVHEDSGKNIPGTSTKDKRPLCDLITSISRPMKGCPDDKKNEFLNELKLFLKSHVILNTNPGSELTNWKTEDEKVATLSFVILDKNKNKLWERKEWKSFRDLITSKKPLRKCGKKMPRYCDVNNDRKITLSEWMNCLETKRAPSENVKVLNESRPTAFTKLKGPNPLESYLKSDR